MCDVTVPVSAVSALGSTWTKSGDAGTLGGEIGAVFTLMVTGVPPRDPEMLLVAVRTASTIPVTS